MQIKCRGITFAQIIRPRIRNQFWRSTLLHLAHSKEKPSIFFFIGFIISLYIYISRIFFKNPQNEHHAGPGHHHPLAGLLRELLTCPPASNLIRVSFQIEFRLCYSSASELCKSFSLTSG